MRNPEEETGEETGTPAQGCPAREPSVQNRPAQGRPAREYPGQNHSTEDHPARTHKAKDRPARPGRGKSKRAPAPRERRWKAAALIGLCCMIGTAAGLYASHRFGGPPPKEKLVYEANIVSGDIPGKTPEQRQRELNSVVEEGMLNMSMNVTPSGRAAGSQAERSVNWLIENPSNQGKLIRVEITRDDTGEKIYETGAIRPGNYVESAPPDVELAAGVYPCTAVFFAYQEETEALIGQAAVKIKLTLQE